MPYHFQNHSHLCTVLFLSSLTQSVVSVVMLVLLLIRLAMVVHQCVTYSNHVASLDPVISTLLNLMGTCVHAVQDTQDGIARVCTPKSNSLYMLSLIHI